MEEVLNIMTHVFGAILFCIALSLLLYYGELEEQAMSHLSENPISSAVYTMERGM